MERTAMPTAEAHVQTDQPSRYLVQLCKHARQVHRLRHRPPAHNGSEGQPPPRVQHVEWTDTDGVVSFGWGQCTLLATPNMLTLRAEAASEETLRRVQEIVASDIERFGKRERLQVTWQRSHPQPPATQPGQAG
jgi:hypothetical protein